MNLEAISRFIKQQGFATLAAVALGYFVWYQFKANEADRNTWTAVVIDQIADLRQKSADAIEVCKKP